MPIIEQVIAKDGTVIERFSPSAAMLLHCMNSAKNPHLSESEVCKLTGISNSLPGKWRNKYGAMYNEWYEETYDTFCHDAEAKALEAIGMVQAMKEGNYQYWRDMARTKGVIKDEVKTQNITINTDFSQILIGDPGQARQRILEELRGVKVKAIEVESEPISVPARIKTTADSV